MDVDVSAKVREAFGWNSGLEKTLDMVATEFSEVAERFNSECVAICAVNGTGAYSVRFWKIGGNKQVILPLKEIAKILAIDDVYSFGWVFCHSHTGPDPQPSEDDDRATCILAWLGKVFDKEMVDHWIIASGHDLSPIMCEENFFSYSSSKSAALSPKIVFEG